jgi:hypothetical protein
MEYLCFFCEVGNEFLIYSFDELQASGFYEEHQYNLKNHVRFEVLLGVRVKINKFSDVTPCFLVPIYEATKRYIPESIKPSKEHLSTFLIPIN